MILLLLFFSFFRIGLFSFGGGYTILSMIYQEISAFGTLTTRQFSDIVALSNVTPGPIAINAATYIGYKSSGIPGALVASVAVVLPSMVILTIVSHFFMKFKDSHIVLSMMESIRPATAGMIAATVVFFVQTSLINGDLPISTLFTEPLQYISIPSIVICALTLVAAGRFKLDPIVLTVAAGILGALIM